MSYCLGYRSDSPNFEPPFDITKYKRLSAIYTHKDLMHDKPEPFKEYLEILAFEKASGFEDPFQSYRRTRTSLPYETWLKQEVKENVIIYPIIKYYDDEIPKMFYWIDYSYSHPEYTYGYIYASKEKIKKRYRVKEIDKITMCNVHYDFRLEIALELDEDIRSQFDV